MTRRGESILTHPLGGTVRTNIEFESVYPGLVPRIEEREAARFAGFSWREYLALERSERVEAVAHYRMAHLIDLHKQDAVAEDAKWRSLLRRSNGG